MPNDIITGDFYHFYIDEGGMFGNAKVCITNNKLKDSEREHDISNYYCGYVTRLHMITYMGRFHHLFSKCKISYDERSVLDNNYFDLK